MEYYKHSQKLARASHHSPSDFDLNHGRNFLQYWSIPEQTMDLDLGSESTASPPQLPCQHQIACQHKRNRHHKQTKTSFTCKTQPVHDASTCFDNATTFGQNQQPLTKLELQFQYVICQA